MSNKYYLDGSKDVGSSKDVEGSKDGCKDGCKDGSDSPDATRSKRARMDATGE